MTKRIPPFQLTSRQRLSLLIAINLSAFQLYLAMPVSLLLYIITLSLWQLLPARKHHRNGGSNTVTTPGLFTRLILIALCILLLYFSYGIQLGRETGTTMITIMTLLKMFEIRNRRDIHIILFTCFFLLATHFFQSQQPGMAIYAFFTVIYLTALLIAFSDKRNNTLFSQHLKTASRLIAFSLPLMLVMFVLFPRIPGPLWGLPDDAFTATTGLSEEMS
ncbi:MAG TPA: DUF3488 domain-containing protein, partial [Thiotrichales bacterium]|nr:DUF3488 domain-containing protein [Thiotrichales bacterium]